MAGEGIWVVTHLNKGFILASQPGPLQGTLNLEWGPWQTGVRGLGLWSSMATSHWRWALLGRGVTSVEVSC